MTIWTTMSVLAFNGNRGILEDRVTGETSKFYVEQVKPCDVEYIEPGSLVIITHDGHVQLATAAFAREYS